MKIMMRGLVAAAMMTAATGAMAAPTIVDVDGIANASIDGSNARIVALAAGTYTLDFTRGSYVAFNRFGTSSDCNASGAACTTGFENSVRYIINGPLFCSATATRVAGLGHRQPVVITAQRRHRLLPHQSTPAPSR